MTEHSAENARPPRVHRAPAQATWQHNYRWGSSLGDSTDLYVRRTDGGSLSISYGTEKIEIRSELVQIVADMVAAAASWTDEPPERCPECGVHRNANPPDNPGIPHSPTCTHNPPASEVDRA